MWTGVKYVITYNINLQTNMSSTILQTTDMLLEQLQTLLSQPCKPQSAAV